MEGRESNTGDGDQIATQGSSSVTGDGCNVAMWGGW